MHKDAEAASGRQTAAGEDYREPLELGDEESRALTRFMYLEGERRSWEGVQMYLMGCHDTLGILQLVGML